MRYLTNNRNSRAGGSPVLKGWIPACAGIACLLFSTLTLAKDAPLEGKEEDYANYYIGVERKGLLTFTEALDQLTPHEKQFLLDYRAVRVEKDEKRLETLIHPDSKACENEMRAPYFAGIREFYLTEFFPEESFKVKYFPVQEEKQWSLKQRLEFPAPPTHILYIEYEDGEYIEGLQRYLREETYPEKRFYELVKCPSVASMEKMRLEAEKRLLEE